MAERRGSIRAADAKGGFGETPTVEGVHYRRLTVTRQRRMLPPAMNDEAQRPRRGDSRIFLTEGACGGIARIGELARLAPIASFPRGLQQALVERGEIRFGHVDLA